MSDVLLLFKGTTVIVELGIAGAPTTDTRAAQSRRVDHPRRLSGEGSKVGLVLTAP